VPEARVVITTAPGEDYGESAVMVSSLAPLTIAFAAPIPS
jgi:hypothetical protein